MVSKGSAALASGTTQTTYLVIKSNVLTAGSTYTFTATVTDTSTAGSYTAAVRPSLTQYSNGQVSDGLLLPQSLSA